MMSPRSVLHAQRQRQRQYQHQHQRQSQAACTSITPTAPTPPSASNNTSYLSPSSPSSPSSCSSLSPINIVSFSPPLASPLPELDHRPLSTRHPSTSTVAHHHPPPTLSVSDAGRLSPTSNDPCNHSSTSSRTPTPTPTTTPTLPPLRWAPKYDERKHSAFITVTPEPLATQVSDATMGKRRDRPETMSLSPSSPPRTTTGLSTRPITPTSPVKIPTIKDHPMAHPQKRHSSQRRRVRDSHTPDSVPLSVAALLAATDISRLNQKSRRRRRHLPGNERVLLADEVVDCEQEPEKDLSWSLSRNPLEILLSPPQDVLDDSESVSDCNIGSALSTRTYSVDSIPSLDEASLTSDGLSSLDTPRTPSPSRRPRFAPMRRSLEPVLSPPGSLEDHPLAGGKPELEEIDFSSKKTTPEEPPKAQLLYQFKPLRSAFKSNLTASIRALKSAAKSFSSMNFATIPPDDLLTRSILTIDPNVPYTDERRPPVTEEIPSAEMRRYLNPTTNSRIEAPAKTVTAGTFAASIQMRTYKIQRSRGTGLPRNAYPSTSLQSSPSPQQPSAQAPARSDPEASVPGMRQREMRENSDFIRIAVMEMAMRKRGKLDDQRPGRARWALPPRKMTTKPYEVAADGVPVRWIPMNS